MNENINSIQNVSYRLDPLEVFAPHSQDTNRRLVSRCEGRQHTQKNIKREEQRTMPLLNLAAIGARRRRSDSYLDDSTSQLSSLPPTEESFSAGSIHSIDSFVYPEVDTFAEDDNESFDPYLKPLITERRIRLRNRLKNLPSFKQSQSPVKEPLTPDTTAYETISESPTSMNVTKASKGRFASFKPPPFLEIPARFSPARIEDSIVIHVEDEKPKVVPGKKEREYWNKVANKQIDNSGIVHLRTADSLLQLGNAHMRCEVSMIDCV